MRGLGGHLSQAKALFCFLRPRNYLAGAPHRPMPDPTSLTIVTAERTDSGDVRFEKGLSHLSYPQLPVLTPPYPFC